MTTGNAIPHPPNLHPGTTAWNPHVAQPPVSLTSPSLTLFRTPPAWSPTGRGAGIGFVSRCRASVPARPDSRASPHPAIGFVSHLPHNLCPSGGGRGIGFVSRSAIPTPHSHLLPAIGFVFRRRPTHVVSRNPLPPQELSLAPLPADWLCFARRLPGCRPPGPQIGFVSHASPLARPQPLPRQRISHSAIRDPKSEIPSIGFVLHNKLRSKLDTSNLKLLNWLCFARPVARVATP